MIKSSSYVALFVMYLKGAFLLLVSLCMCNYKGLTFFTPWCPYHLAFSPLSLCHYIQPSVWVIACLDWTQLLLVIIWLWLSGVFKFVMVMISSWMLFTWVKSVKQWSAEPSTFWKFGLSSAQLGMSFEPQWCPQCGKFAVWCLHNWFVKYQSVQCELVYDEWNNVPCYLHHVCILISPFLPEFHEGPLFQWMGCVSFEVHLSWVWNSGLKGQKQVAPNVLPGSSAPAFHQEIDTEKGNKFPVLTSQRCRNS